MADRDTRQWRALALSGAAACGLLTLRALTGRPLVGELLRRRELAAARTAGSGQPVDEGELWDETPSQIVLRRLGACEAHLADLEERIRNERLMGDRDA